jgi:hypothetical protein
MEPDAVPMPPPRRGNSWSLRRIVHEVAGQPLEAFQDPAREPHPYVAYVTTHRAPPDGSLRPLEPPDPELAPERPIPRTERRPSPPPEMEPAPVLDTEPPEHVEFPIEAEALTAAPPVPSRRPERMYLHQLLLRLDQLDDHALRHLQSEVDEELAHRAETRRRGERPAVQAR